MKNNQIIKKFLHAKKEEQKRTVPPVEEWSVDLFPTMLVSELASANFRLSVVSQLYFKENDAIFYEQLLRKYFYCFPKTLRRTNIDEEVYVRQLFAIVAAAFDSGFDKDSQAAQNLFRIVKEQKNVLFNEIINSSCDPISYDSLSESARSIDSYSIRDSIERYQNSITSFLFLAKMTDKTAILSNFDIRNIENLAQHLHDPNFNLHIPEDALDYFCWNLGFQNPLNITDTNLIEYILSNYDEPEAELLQEELYWDADAKNSLLNHTIFYLNSTTRMYKLGDSSLLHQPITQKHLLNAFDNFYNFAHFEDDCSSNGSHRAETLIHYIIQELILDCLHQAKNEMVDMLFFD